MDGIRGTRIKKKGKKWTLGMNKKRKSVQTVNVKKVFLFGGRRGTSAAKEGEVCRQV